MEEAFLKNTDITKCASCGATMEFVPDKQALFCAHCESERKISAPKLIFLNDFFQAKKSAPPAWEEATAFRCASCGAVTYFDKHQIGTKCPFCDAPNIVEAKELPGMKPDGVLPFSIGRENAKAFYLKWIKKRIFAPSKLKKNFTVDNMNGVYLPNFSFDSRTVSSYDGRLGRRETRVVGSGKNRRTEVYIRYFNVSGTIGRDFNNMIIEASANIEQKDLDRVLPFDSENTLEYTPEFVAGFSAEQYATGLTESFGVAQDKMKAILEREIVARYNADVKDYLNINTVYNSVLYRYLLLPLWMCAYRFKEKIYRFLVNGRTGKVGGKTPVSPLRVGLLSAIIIAVILLIYFLTR